MGYYEDHIKAVAKRQAERLKSGKSASVIRKHLVWCGWQPGEVDTIMAIAERTVHNERCEA